MEKNIVADGNGSVELIFAGPGCALRHMLDAGDWQLIGSDDAARIVIADVTVSRRHAEVRFDGSAIWLRDLGSRNGSFIAGRRVKPGDAQSIPATAAVLLGEVALSWRDLGAGDAELALPMGHDQRIDPGPSAGATLSTQPLDPWTRLALPELLKRLSRGCQRAEFAAAMAQGWLQHLPIDAIEIVDASQPLATAADVPLLFSSHPAPQGAISERRVLRHTEWRVQWRAGFRPNQFEAIWDIAESMLRLCAEREEPSVPASESPNVRAGLSMQSNDPVMQRIYRQAMRAARSGIHVLIRGESGTGKELLARHIHQHAADGDLPFVAVNCAALSEDLLESELFGVERRVATGVDERHGLFERADGGFVFLDEIGDMSLATQSRILRVLQEGEVMRVGGSRARPARVRVISATHKPLAKMVDEGSFRLDLMHRISDWEVELPPLRERLADIGPLALHFLTRSAHERDVRLRGISRGALDALLGYSWPGNVRELEREMNRVAVFLDQGATVMRSDLRSALREVGPDSAADARLEPQLARAERRIIDRALTQTSGNINATAELLGISRATLYRKLGQTDDSRA